MPLPKHTLKYGLRLLAVIVATLITAGASLLSGKNTQTDMTQQSANAKTSDNTKRQVGNRTVHLDSYNDALWVLWNKVYPGQAASLYCGKQFNTQRGGKVSQQGINAEHVFPMDWAVNTLKCGTRKACRRKLKLFRLIEADLHNIYPSLIKLNSERMSFPFGEIKGEKRQFGESCDFEVDRKRRIVEPRNAVRGDIARAMLYMSYQYDLPLFEKTKKRLIAWHKQDAPSKEEKRRAKIIEQIQGRENPFITRYPFKGDK